MGKQKGNKINEDKKMKFTRLSKESLESRYNLLKLLGSGTYAEVWETEKKVNGKKIAVKILQGRKKDEKNVINEVLKENMNEIETLQKLNHPNIVCLYETIIYEDRIYLFQEIGEKGDLFDFMFGKENNCRETGRGFNEPTALFFFKQLMNAVCFMHKSGYAHRDIKIENCLVTKSKKLLLCDFGMTTRKTKCNDRCGTLDYISPEIILSDRNSDNDNDNEGNENNKNKNNTTNDKKKDEKNGWFNPFVTDIWACGVFLYYILTSDLPFSEKTKVDTENAIILGQFQFPEYVSENAKDLIKKMIVVDPNKRITAENIMKHTFFTNNQKEEEEEEQEEEQEEENLNCVDREQIKFATKYSKTISDYGLQHA